MLVLVVVVLLLPPLPPFKDENEFPIVVGNSRIITIHIAPSELPFWNISS